MSGFLRFVRIVDAAAWCGASIFMLVALPALFSPQVESLLTKPYVGFAAEAIFQRYFLFYYFCGLVALVCVGAEWVYSGKESRFDFMLVSVLTGVGMLIGLLLQPRMHDWHYFMYWGRTAEIRAHAARWFGIWHGVSQSINLFLILGLLIYLWRSARPSETPRFVGFNKIRG